MIQTVHMVHLRKSFLYRKSSLCRKSSLYKRSFLCAAGLALAFAAPASAETGSKTIFAMDTVMTLQAEGPDAQAAVDAASAEILRIDQLLSTGNENSQVSIVNRDGKGALTEEMKVLMEYSERLYNETDGAFDITVYPAMQLWGFPTQEYHVPTEEELDAVRQLVDFSQLKYDVSGDQGEISFAREGMAIDFGAIAKGYTSARIMQLFEEMGMENGLISLGGNVHAFRCKSDGSPWRIGIRNPFSPDEGFLGVLEVDDEAVITSGGYERYFEQDGKTYHHILDPKTCVPSDSGLVSVTIVSHDGTLADGLSTSLFVMGLEKSEAYWQDHKDEFEMILEQQDGSIYITEGLEGRFTSDYPFEVLNAG